MHSGRFSALVDALVVMISTPIIACGGHTGWRRDSSAEKQRKSLHACMHASSITCCINAGLENGCSRY
jgi:hypothetical protein